MKRKSFIHEVRRKHFQADGRKRAKVLWQKEV